MRVREPVVAGQFYPSEPTRCRADMGTLLDGADGDRGYEEPLMGGLVPHAGWPFSGRTAARVFHALSQFDPPGVVVLFGAVHRPRGREAALFGSGRWQSPIGPVEIDARLAERILGQTNLIIDDPYAHESEHSLEVQIPFLVRLFPGVPIVPIMVPPTEKAKEVGEAVGRTLTSYDYHALVICTTDLTHYGPRYGFTPHGIGIEGIEWAKQQNDKRFIELVLDLRAGDVVAEAVRNRNACGSGAVAAALAALTALKASSARLLEHTTSAEVTAGRSPCVSEDSVGYAGIVFF